MSVLMNTFDSREEWLENRKTIGGSDAACILGKNPWKSNVDLFLEKTGLSEPEDISNNEFVKYGTEAEEPLRKLYALDYPEFVVEYQANNLWVNDKYPWAHASLDGWLKDKDGRKGILEIKTTNIMSRRQKEEWTDQIPEQYYCQLLHYLAVTEFDFAVLKARLKWKIEGDVYCQVKHYRFERSEREEDIEYLMNEEKKFVEEYLAKRRKPALLLPSF